MEHFHDGYADKSDIINIPRSSFLSPCQSGGFRGLLYSHGSTNTFQSSVCGVFLSMLTLAWVPCGFIAGETLALAHGNHPFALSWAVDARGGLTDGVLHTGPLHLPQSVCHGLREGCQALHCGRARFVVHPDRQQSHTCTHVLKSQVEASSRQRPHRPRLRVHF